MTLAAYMECKFCGNNCRKAGKQANGAQRYFCSSCKKYQQIKYKYQACKSDISPLIGKLLCEGVGIRGISRILKIALKTVLKKILLQASKIPKPPIPLYLSTVELDELRTYIGRKENQYWVAYAFCRETKRVLDFVVGKRSKRVLRRIVINLLLSEVKTIKTDDLNIYQSLIPPERHRHGAYQINHIERNNLNLRTHLKRLARRTICFSKNIRILESSLRIYFWNHRVAQYEV